MRLIKKFFKWLLYFLMIPVLFLIVSLILSAITIDRIEESQVANETVYLSTNGVHLDIVIPIDNIHEQLLKEIRREQSDKYLSFGWGDENFYINTPTWGDLTFKNAFKAMFLKSTTLMHVTRYKSIRSEWIEIKITTSELDKLNSYIENTFKTNEIGKKILLENQGYASVDDFYKAKGSYSCFNTCNSWVNSAFKESGLKSCFWTPFDFGLIKKYEQ